MKWRSAIVLMAAAMLVAAATMMARGGLTGAIVSAAGGPSQKIKVKSEQGAHSTSSTTPVRVTGARIDIGGQGKALLVIDFSAVTSCEGDGDEDGSCFVEPRVEGVPAQPPERRIDDDASTASEGVELHGGTWWKKVGPGEKTVRVLFRTEDADDSIGLGRWTLTVERHPR